MTTVHHAKLWLHIFILTPWALACVEFYYTGLQTPATQYQQNQRLSDGLQFFTVNVAAQKPKAPKYGDFSNSEVQAFHTISTILNMRPGEYRYR